MPELRTGVRHRQASHPEWSADAEWPQEVSSYAIDDGAQLLLFDPLAVPEELVSLAAEREPVIVLRTEGSYAAPASLASSRGSLRETICETPSPPIVTP